MIQMFIDSEYCFPEVIMCKVSFFSLQPMHLVPWFLNVCFRWPDLLMRRLSRALCVIIFVILFYNHKEKYGEMKDLHIYFSFKQVQFM